MPKRPRDENRNSPNDIRQKIGKFQSDNITQSTSWQHFMYEMQQENQKLHKENDNLRNQLASATHALTNLKHNQKICVEQNQTLKNSAKQMREEFEKQYNRLQQKFMNLWTQANHYASSLVNPNNRGVNAHTLHVHTTTFLAFLQQLQQ